MATLQGCEYGATVKGRVDAMKTIEQLLEQHDHYDIGDGFTVARRDGGHWMAYHNGLHVECRDATFYGRPIPDEDDLTSFPSAIQAVKAAHDIRLIADWAAENVRESTTGER